MAKQLGKRTVGELEEELKARDRRIEELRTEIDELRDLVTRLREQEEDADNLLESWIGAFNMVMNEDGKYSWSPFVEQYDKLVDKYADLVRRWNKYITIFNAQNRNVGRPLAASEAQVEEVRRLRREGRSLRGIADDTSLGFPTVRTIVGQMYGDDRTTQKHRDRLERIEIDREQRTQWKAKRHSRDALPRRIQATLKQGRAPKRQEGSG
jgi:hypothetical protein